MAGVALIQTYSDLQAQVQDHLRRQDLSPQITMFIQLAEAEIKRRLRRTTVRASVNISAYANALPSDCAQLRSVDIATQNTSLNVPLAIVSKSMLAEFQAGSPGTGQPQWAALYNATTMLVAPAPDQTYLAEVTYYQGLSALSATNTSNTVLVEAPDLYLYMTLAQTAPYLINDDRIQTWRSFADKAIDELNLVAQREEYGASYGPLRLPTVFGA